MKECRFVIAGLLMVLVALSANGAVDSGAFKRLDSLIAIQPQIIAANSSTIPTWHTPGVTGFPGKWP